MPDVPPINPCLECRPESSVLATIAAIALQSDGVAGATQLRVTVAGNNVATLPSGTYQSIFMKNTGLATVWIRTASGADSSGANGEIPLAGETTAGAGDGGDVTIETFSGQITSACATSGTLSVTFST